MSLPAHRQQGRAVRLEWGLGAVELAAEVDVAVVVDVLSFTTTLSIAVERGTAVEPTAWRGPAEAGSGPRLLSPAAMLRREPTDHLVLPSPNGAATCAALAGLTTVVGACLRNAAAVAAWLAPQLDAGATVLLVPAGERWPDGSLRPAAEDLWGAGAVLAHLRGHDLSAEARLAVATHDAVEDDLLDALRDCASGRELVDQGYAEDVDVAAGIDASAVVPVLEAGVFTAS